MNQFLSIVGNSQNRVFINGVEVTPTNGSKEFIVIVGDKTYNFTGDVRVEVRGDCGNINATSANINVSGDCGNIKTTSGNVNCGNVTGKVEITNGNVNGRNIGGNVSTTSGSVKVSGDIGGKVSTISGSINR